MVTKNQHDNASSSTSQGGPGDDTLVNQVGDERIDGGAGHDVLKLSGRLAQYRFTPTSGGIWITDLVPQRDGIDFVSNVELASFADVQVVLPSAATGAVPPRAVDDVIRLDGEGQPLARSEPHLIAARQLLANDLDWHGSGLQIDTLSEVVGGSASLTEAGDVLFTPDAGGAGVMSFRYTVRDLDGHRTADPAEVHLQGEDLPKDPLLAQQWHLAQANVLPVWRDYTGRGVTIGQFEPGGDVANTRLILDLRHRELAPRLNQAWRVNAAAGYRSGSERDHSNPHATVVAAVMCAANNEEAGVGVAHGATIGGHWMHNDDSLAAMRHYDIANNSWGPRYRFSLITQPAIINGLLPPFADAVRRGRDGLGTVIVATAGNERIQGDNTNYASIRNSRSNITVGAVARHDGSRRVVQRFSTPGANVLVSAPGVELLSGVGAPDMRVTGTSFAAPIVSGIVALMLEANPALGYRDVQQILALSARKVEDPGSDWQVNGASHWNGGGMLVSHDYGYGEVDARAAVRLAECWITQQTTANESRAARPAQSGVLDLAIPDDGTRLLHRLPLALSMQPALPAADLLIEHVEVRIRLSHAHPGDLTIKLISPAGTESVLMERPGRQPQALPDDHGDDAFFDGASTLEHVFTSARMRGEHAAGSWTLDITDAVTGKTGVLHEWSLNAYGSVASADDHHVYTDAFAQLAAQPGRNVLKDDNGGVDTINLAAMGSSSQVDLQQGQATVAGQTLLIEQPGDIDNVIGGESDDTLVGNDGANVLVGGRGGDRLDGGDGDDVLVISRDGGSTVSGGAGRDLFVIELGPGKPWESTAADDVITDFTLGEDKLLMSGFSHAEIYRQFNVETAGRDAVLRIYNGSRRIVLKNVNAYPDQMYREWMGGLIFGDGDENSVTVAAGVQVRELVGSGKRYWGSDAADDIVATDSGTFWLGNLDDRAVGAGDNDVMHGGAGNDVLYGDAVSSENEVDDTGGDDVLFGDAGDDELHGAGGHDTLHGGAGQDLLFGGDGNDILYLEGDDALAGHVQGDGLFMAPRIRLEDGRLPGARVEGGAGGDRFVIVADRSERVSSGLMKNLIADFDVGHPGEKIDLSKIVGVRGLDDLDFSILRYRGERYLRVWLGPASDGTQYFTLSGVDAWQLDDAHFIFSDDGASPLRAPPAALHGTADDDFIVGDDGANTIDGGRGADRMLGRAGDDTYAVDHIDDLVIERPNAGYDHVRSNVSYTLAEHVEALTLRSRYEGDVPWYLEGYSYGNAHATGNALDNAIDGNVCDNIIDGRAGADVMAGGRGDDSYIVDDAGDRVVEHEDEGRDTVKSSVSFLLDAHIERLELTGRDAINGCGNDLDNRIIGNLGANRLLGGLGNDSIDGAAGDDQLFGGVGDDRLVGGAGHDLLDGGAGNDVLIGEAGDDSYLLARGMGQDYAWEEDDATGRADRVVVGPGLSQQDIVVRRDGDDLLLLIADSDEGMRVGNWFADGRHRIAQVQFSDGSIWDSAAIADRTRTADADALRFGKSWSATIMAVRAEAADFRNDPFKDNDIIGRDSIYGYGAPVQDTLPLLENMGRRHYQGSQYKKVSAGIDTVKIGAGYTVQDLSLYRGYGRSEADTDLYLSLPTHTGGSVSITLVKGHDRARVDFADGTLWDNATVREKLKPGVQRGIWYGGHDDATYSHNKWHGYDDASDVFHGGGHDDVMYGLHGEDHLDGGDGRDRLYGGGANDVLIGGAGDDWLHGGDDDDVLDGGAGNDVLSGDKGSDTYLMYRGMGRDRIIDSNRHDDALNLIKVVDGVRPDEIIFSRDTRDLFMDIAGTDDRMTIAGMFSRPFESIDAMEFTDGTRWDFRELERRSRTATASEDADILYGTDHFQRFSRYRSKVMQHGLGTDLLHGLGGNDDLYGYGGNDLLDGGEGDDLLRGDAGRDLLIGGRGNDILYGCREPDVIAFNRGDGRDKIETIYHFERFSQEANNPGGTLSLGGIGYQDLALSRSGNDLLLELGQDDGIRFGDWYQVWNSHMPFRNAEGKIVQRLQFVTETTDDYQSGSADPMHGKKVAWFDFHGLVDKFDQARAVDPGLDQWSIAAALGEFHLRSSDTFAYGGELAYRYATQGDWRGADPQLAMHAVHQNGFGRIPRLIASETYQDGFSFG